MDSMLKTYRQLVHCAKLGHIDAILKVLEDMSWHLENNKKVPKPYVDFFIECTANIDANEPELNKSFNVNLGKEGRKYSHGDLFKKHMNIIKYANELIEEGCSEDKSYEMSGEKYGASKRTVRTLFNNHYLNDYLDMNKPYSTTEISADVFEFCKIIDNNRKNIPGKN